VRALVLKDSSIGIYDCTTENGTVKTINMHDKWSTIIFQELLDTSGGESWKKWKQAAEKDGLPLFPGEGKAAAYVPPDRGTMQYQTLKEWREGAKAREVVEQKKKAAEKKAEVKRLAAEKVNEEKRLANAKQAKEEKERQKNQVVVEDELAPEIVANLQNKTGAAAVLP